MSISISKFYFFMEEKKKTWISWPNIFLLKKKKNYAWILRENKIKISGRKRNNSCTTTTNCASCNSNEHFSGKRCTHTNTHTLKNWVLSPFTPDSVYFLSSYFLPVLILINNNNNGDGLSQFPIKVIIGRRKKNFFFFFCVCGFFINYSC